jgi:hypothetical protein
MSRFHEYRFDGLRDDRQFLPIVDKTYALAWIAAARRSTESFENVPKTLRAKKANSTSPLPPTLTDRTLVAR